MKTVNEIKEAISYLLPYIQNYKDYKAKELFEYIEQSLVFIENISEEFFIQINQLEAENLKLKKEKSALISDFKDMDADIEEDFDDIEQYLKKRK